MQTALATDPRPQRVLLLGLGTGALARLALASDPQVEVDAVEIDPAVVTAATRWFGVQPSARLRVHVEEAAAFLRGSDDRYDLVWVDCFDAKRIPEHLQTDAFAARVAGRTTVVAANLVRTHENYAALVRRWRRVLCRPWRIEGVRSTNHAVVGGTISPLTFDRARARALGLESVVARATPVPC
jgi:spermidine synthase